ncbi:hypothetical protein IJJ18_01970 [Candidatus Saccharibacteria bacterium]|nr:hypothetical protein [Candidatus Saccharibacteria bacterium]
MGKITITDPIASSATHNTLQSSTAFSRKYVCRPVAPNRVSDIRPVKAARPKAVLPKAVSPKAASPKAASLKATSPKVTSPAVAAKEAKDRAVKSALRSVATMENAEKKAVEEGVKATKPTKIKTKKKTRRLVFAVLCSAATVALLALFINANMPDISVRVAAMQTGIEASYPTYIPRGYSLNSVTSEKTGQITMHFSNGDGNSFRLVEENSTWDSTALLNNYVKPDFGDFATLREQGVTIYTHATEAAWVNGGIFYRISAQGEALTKEQIRNLVTSL